MTNGNNRKKNGRNDIFNIRKYMFKRSMRSVLAIPASGMSNLFVKVQPERDGDS